MASILNFENEVFSCFAFYASLMIVKMIFMSFWTAKVRITKRVFANKEDHPNKKSEYKPVFNDEDVERLRRNHLNDLENIPAFIFLGFLYVLTEPAPAMAILHFRVFAVSRIIHMLAYQLPLPQPCRALTFFVGVLLNVSMAVQILTVASW